MDVDSQIRSSSVIYNDEIKITGYHQSDKNSINGSSMGINSYAPADESQLKMRSIDSEKKFDISMSNYNKILKNMKDRDTK